MDTQPLTLALSGDCAAKLGVCMVTTQTGPRAHTSDSGCSLLAHPLLGVDETHPDLAKPKPTGLVGSSQLAPDKGINET